MNTNPNSASSPPGLPVYYTMPPQPPNVYPPSQPAPIYTVTNDTHCHGHHHHCHDDHLCCTII